jgi:hypothetical protein
MAVLARTSARERRLAEPENNLDIGKVQTA